VKKVYQGIRRAFHDPTSRWYNWVDGVVLVLILLSVALTAYELSEGHPFGSNSLALALDRGLLVLFSIEVGLRILTYEPPHLKLLDLQPAERLRGQVIGRLRYCFHPVVFFDLLTVLALHPALRGLRALRFLRLLTRFRVFHYSNPLATLGAAFQDNALLYVFAFLVLGLETVIGGVTLYFIEGQTNPSIDSVWDGMWWTLVTLTTVGYGDITPQLALGRMWGSLLMVAGMVTLALFAGIVGHTLLNTVLTLREEQFRMATYSNHVVIFGYSPGSADLLKALSAELTGPDTEIVLMGPGDRPSDLPSRFRWISGEPTRDEEMAKVGLFLASAVAIIADRNQPPHAADATTILTLFTLRAFMNQQKGKRKFPVHVVAEILDAENIDHARTAGADEVIASQRLSFNLVAHAVAQPGTADLVANVARAGAHSVYVGRLPDQGLAPFEVVAATLKASHDALLIGIRRDGTDHLNPPNDLEVHADDDLLYLATRQTLMAQGDRHV